MNKNWCGFILGLLLVLLGCIVSHGQDRVRIDSLHSLLEQSPALEGQYQLLEEIARDYMYNDVDSCIKYASMLLVKASNNQDTLWMANAEKAMAGSLCVAGNLSSGLKHNLTAKAYFEKIRYEEGIYGCTQNIGFIYNMMDEPHQAIAHFHQAIPYFENTKNQTVLDIIYKNIITSFTVTNQLDSASHYLRKLEQRSGDRLATHPVGLSILKANLFTELNELDSAKAYYNKEYSVSKEYGNDYQSNAALIGLGKLHKKIGEYDTAINYFEIAEDICVTNNYQRTLTEILANKAEIYDSIQNYKAAFYTTNKLKTLKSEIYQQENLNNLTELKIKYESEKSDLELAKQKAILSKTILIQKNEATKTKMIFIAIGFILISLLINMYLKRQNRQKLEFQKKQIESQQDKIVGSINYAKRIQDSILRPQGEIQEIFPSSFVFFKPKDIVSGDFYWFKEFGDVKIIATVDCIGHGVPGAFMSLIANNLLEKHATEDRFKTPGVILEKLHEELRENANVNTAYQGMDMSLCVICEKEKTLYFSGARNSAYIVNHGSFQQLDADPWSIGAETTKEVTFRTQRYQFQKDDVLYMYTDGMIDQFGGEKAKKLNNTKFKKLISDLEAIKFKQVPSYINNFLNDWQGNIAQTDDILIFGVKID